MRQNSAHELRSRNEALSATNWFEDRDGPPGYGDCDRFAGVDTVQ